MAPAIVLSPMPRWRRLLGRTVLSLVFLLVAAAAFWLGRHTAGTKLDDLVPSPFLIPFESAMAMPPPAVEPVSSPSPSSTPTSGVIEAGEHVATSSPTLPSTADETGGEVADGMMVESFTFRQEGARTGRYRYAAVNAGRQFLGELQFRIEGEQQGRPIELTLPAETAGSNRVSIRHRLHSGGTLWLPEDIRVGTVEIRLIQDGTVRARRALELDAG